MPKDNRFDELLDTPVKLVVQEPGQHKPHILYGVVLSLDDNMILFKSKSGTGSFNRKYIIAIKPQ